jgi:hypothetical protein
MLSFHSCCCCSSACQVLEDIALTVQNQLDSKLPFCAFNGGNDVFVDVGNKSLGLECLMSYLGSTPQEVRSRQVHDVGLQEAMIWTPLHQCRSFWQPQRGP